MASSSRWSWRTFPTERERSRTTSASAGWIERAKRNGANMSSTWLQSWSQPSNPTTWSSAEAMSRSSKSCRPAAGPATTPTRFWAVSVSGKNHPIARLLRSPRPVHDCRQMTQEQNACEVESAPITAGLVSRNRDDFDRLGSEVYSCLIHHHHVHATNLAQKLLEE